MTTLNKNNRNPRTGYRGNNALTFENVAKLLIEQGNGVATQNAQVGVGNNTVVRFRRVGHDDPQAIEVKHFETVVAVLYDDRSVQLVQGGRTETERTKTTKERLDWCLLPLGYRLTSVKFSWKVYSITSGQYRDYFNGMIVRKGEF